MRFNIYCASGSELFSIFPRQITIINSKFCYISLNFSSHPFFFTENGFHWRKPSPQICQKASIEARGRWKSSDLRVWAEWPSAARGHLVSSRSSSSHVFTIPESSNLRFFSRNFLWSILYKVEGFYWSQKFRFNGLSEERKDALQL